MALPFRYAQQTVFAHFEFLIQKVIIYDHAMFYIASLRLSSQIHLIYLYQNSKFNPSQLIINPSSWVTIYIFLDWCEYTPAITEAQFYVGYMIAAISFPYCMAICQALFSKVYTVHKKIILLLTVVVD